MIAIFVSYNQAFNDEIVELLEQFGQRGFTRWDEVVKAENRIMVITLGLL